jgi:hypothetical protein
MGIFDVMKFFLGAVGVVLLTEAVWILVPPEMHWLAMLSLIVLGVTYFQRRKALAKAKGNRR